MFLQSMFRLGARTRRVVPALALAALLSGCGSSLVPVSQLVDGGAAVGEGGTAAAQPAGASGSGITWPFVELPDGRIISVLCH